MTLAERVEESMRRGSLIFMAGIFLISALLLKATLSYSFKAKLFPMITLITVLLLLTILIINETVVALKEKGSKDSNLEKGPAAKQLAVWGWMLGTVLMFSILGFMGTVILLPFLYLRLQRESWPLSLAVSAGCGLFFYGIFDLGLKMPLYPGLILTKALG